MSGVQAEADARRVVLEASTRPNESRQRLLIPTHSLSRRSVCYTSKYGRRPHAIVCNIRHRHRVTARPFLFQGTTEPRLKRLFPIEQHQYRSVAFVNVVGLVDDRPAILMAYHCQVVSEMIAKKVTLELHES